MKHPEHLADFLEDLPTLYFLTPQQNNLIYGYARIRLMDFIKEFLLSLLSLKTSSAKSAPSKRLESWPRSMQAVSECVDTRIKLQRAKGKLLWIAWLHRIEEFSLIH